MVKIEEDWIWKDGHKIGYIQGHKIFTEEGHRVGYVTDDGVHETSGRKIGWMEGDHIRTPDGDRIPISSNRVHVQGDGYSDIVRAGVRLLLGD